jgi:hypothetical protein
MKIVNAKIVPAAAKTHAPHSTGYSLAHQAPFGIFFHAVLTDIGIHAALNCHWSRRYNHFFAIGDDAGALSDILQVGVMALIIPAT